MSNTAALIEYLITAQGIKRRALVTLEGFIDACKKAGHVRDNIERAYLAEAFDVLDDFEKVLDGLIEYMENAP